MWGLRHTARGNLVPRLWPRAFDGARPQTAELLHEVTAPEVLPRGARGFMGFVVARHFRFGAGLMAVLTVAATVLEAAAPFVLARIIDALPGAAESGGLAALAPMIALVGVLWVAGAILHRAAATAELYVAPRMRALAQKYLFIYLLGHSPRYFQENFAGKLGQKVKQAGQATVTLLQLVAVEAFRIVVLVTVAAGLLAFENWWLAAGLAVWSALYIAAITALARRCLDYSLKLSDEMSTLSGRIIDAVANADLVRAFAKADFERRFLSGFIAREMHASQRLRWFLNIMNLAMKFAVIVLQLGLLIGAAWAAIAGHISIGAFALVFFLAQMIASSVQDLSWRILDFFEELGTLQEGLDLVTHPHEITDAPGAMPLKVSAGEIRLEAVRFAHGDGHPVFEGLDLHIRPGEKVGLVGPSGAGKSTLVKLLRRQFEPQGGRILIDGQDIAQVTWDSLNAAIAEVPQTPGVFHRTVGDNIRYAEPDAGDEAVMAAAHQAHAHEFIARRASGYDTIVGEQGIKLSGGERQRVAIARALVKDARILVLDEATSSLDSESEHLIQEALLGLMAGRTVIAIAHRLSTIVGMDRILYLERGRIVEDGSHADLLARGGAYARLWSRQAGGFIQDDAA